MCSECRKDQGGMWHRTDILIFSIVEISRVDIYILQPPEVYSYFSNSLFFPLYIEANGFCLEPT